MRVAFDHQIFSAQRYGGVSRYFFELASRLPIDTVSEVTVVAPWHVNSYLSLESATRFARGRYIPYSFRGIARLVRLANALTAPLAWSGVNPDIVHETYYSERPIGRAPRRVVTVYDMIHELFPNDFGDAAKVTAAKRASVMRADHVICISERTRQDLIRLFGLEQKRTSVVHLGCSLVADHRQGHVNAGDGKPILLFVGNRSGYKNFQTLLEAYASSPILKEEFELITFGGAPLSSTEVNELQRLGVANSVRHETGGDEGLALRYRMSAALIYPSLYEGFGIPPLEAMSNGCPVVCSNRGSIPEVVGDAGVYFEPTSPEELRVTLERVVTDRSVQDDLRVRGYARLQAFSWDACALATAEVYQRVR